MRRGATDYYATFDHLAGRYGIIVNTVSASVDINAHLHLLAVNGALVNVGVPPRPVEVDIANLMRARRSIAGSIIGGDCVDAGNAGLLRRAQDRR